MTAIPLHDDLSKSPLGEMLSMQPLVDASDPRAEWLGKRVRYKRGLDWTKLGTRARDETFIVGGVQDDYKGEPRLRIYSEREVSWLGTERAYRCFGRVGNMEELEIVQ